MIKFWNTGEPEHTPIPLALPERLGHAETVRLLGGAFDLMIPVLLDGADISDRARRAGYTHVLSENQTPSLSLESFVHEREEHRLLLNTHRYPKYTRRVLHLTIPGGMALDALERFRQRRSFLGSTYYWHDHIYGEWRTDKSHHKSYAAATPLPSPVFIELRQDVFQGEPLLLRVTFHRLAARHGVPADT